LKRRTAWLVASAVFLVVAGVVLGRGENAGKIAARRARLERIQFPRYPKGDEYERMQRRKTLPPLPGPVAPSPTPAPAEPEQGRDPLLSALGPRRDIDIVFEAGAFYRMPLAEQLLECFGAEARMELDRLREKTGIDAESVDRIAVGASENGEPTVMVTAKFDPAMVGARLPASWERVTHGEKGTLFVEAGGGSPPTMIGMWSDALILVSDSKGDLEAALDRVEGRAPPSVPAILPETAYGEVYGHVRASVFAKMLPPEIAEAARAAKDVELHVDAMEDLLVVADVTGGSPADMQKLARTFGGALSAARLTARAQGNDSFSELLDLARVTPSVGSFTVEAAMPVDFIKKQLGGCSKRH
jgi:hypothetical protein